MMITMENAKRGMLAYVNDQILPKLTGIQKVGVAVYVDLASNKLVDVVKQYSTSPYVSVLNVVDGDNIDVDRLRNCILTHIGSQKLQVKIPLVGEIAFDRNDIDKLYNRMRQI